jgi:3-oxoacyl-(acyl-carrier-protein) synthase
MKLDRPLAICGLGGVSPAGIGVETLLAQRQIAPEKAAVFGSGELWPVFRVDLKQERLARWANEARLRRASAIALFMIDAAKQALGETSPVSLGIVAAYGTGAVIPTRRFYEGVIKSGPRFASPNIFPETVFNSPTSHIAAVLGANGPCYSVLGDESAWVNAIGVAATWLANGLVEHVLVIGAEEFDPIILDAFVSVRWLRRDKPFVSGEGAGAVLLRLAQSGDKLRVTEFHEGFTYRNKREAGRAAEECVVAALYERRENDGRRSRTATTVMKSAQRNWFASIESELHHAHNFATPAALPYCGDAFTASAAWNTVRTASLVAQAGGRLLQPVWGLNEQCSALLLEAG